MSNEQQLKGTVTLSLSDFISYVEATKNNDSLKEKVEWLEQQVQDIQILNSIVAEQRNSTKYIIVYPYTREHYIGDSIVGDSTTLSLYDSKIYNSYEEAKKVVDEIMSDSRTFSSFTCSILPVITKTNNNEKA